MLQNAYLLAKIGADTAENEQHFAKNCQEVRRGADVLLQLQEADGDGEPRGERRRVEQRQVRPEARERLDGGLGN